MSIEIPWPPSFTIKKHPRARHVKLKTSAKHGLELVVPMRFNQKHIPEILELNKEWIEKHLKKLQQNLQDVASDTLPNTISLTAIGQIWQIAYIKSDSKKLRLFERPGQELVIYGDISEIQLCKKILSAWAKNKAKIILPERLELLSHHTKLHYSNISIRNQQTRWGSCSIDKSISLNYKLLFLPPELMIHILIHELCHTVHLNHSGKFWRLVASFDVDWKKHSSDVRKADKYIPPWIG